PVALRRAPGHRHGGGDHPGCVVDRGPAGGAEGGGRRSRAGGAAGRAGGRGRGRGGVGRVNARRARLSRLAPKIQDALAVEARKSRYREDPVAWVTGFLGRKVWSKQKEILYSI